jgi:peptidyl-prolyl cis-trans isomerase C/peptidyl-prolyl cis-trans isomerase D
MSYCQVIVTTLLFAFGFSAASSVHAQVLARVGNTEITLKEFETKLNDIRKKSINPPTPEQFLEDLVRYEVGLQEARKRKLENDPAVRQAMNEELYKGLVERSIGDKVNKIKVNEKEMRAFYAKNPELRTSHILIEVKPNATPEEKAVARKRAEEILAEVKKSKRPFEELVKLYTDDTFTKNNGGDLGYQNRVTLVPSYYDAILRMKMNDTSGLVETPYGFHIIKLTGRRSYEQANKQQLRTAVFDEKRKNLFNEFFTSLKSKYKIETNRKLLSTLK